MSLRKFTEHVRPRSQVCLQAEHEAVRAQAAAASRAAEAAEKRCEELQWRLQQQDAALAQRARLAEEARAATEGLSKVHCSLGHVHYFHPKIWRQLWEHH